ncbi:uncharacterized protein HD556DRAFT_1310766 [Suillus plorans]|uniref:Ras-GAP domain-containing protein n=1 Tax=Suillus plorans TaxID=116603 RepID=A0A9P7AIF4_9AGAM|nr:uncharacterized protein HD556DRAFT_1310766 [Suillus plorans]KAG1790159.1 hypothetical protein HD556DRAFT_1310766 [Suillus plorans]
MLAPHFPPTVELLEVLGSRALPAKANRDKYKWFYLLEAYQVWPESKFAALGAFIFLQFISSAIVAPEIVDVTVPRDDSGVIRRGLMVIAKGKLLVLGMRSGSIVTSTFTPKSSIPAHPI